MQVLNYGIEKHLIFENPAKNRAVTTLLKQIKKDAPQNRTVVLSTEEIIAIVEAYRGTTIGVIIAIAGLSGLRLGEIRGLTSDSFLDDQIKVTQQLSRNNEPIPLKSVSSVRNLPLHPYLKEIIEEYELKKKEMAERFPESYYKSPYLVVNTDNLDVLGRPVSRTTIGKMLEKVKREQNLDDNLTLHHFRHSFGSNLVTGGIPIPVVSKWMGHGDSSITLKVYVHEVEARKDENTAAYIRMVGDSIDKIK